MGLLRPLEERPGGVVLYADVRHAGEGAGLPGSTARAQRHRLTLEGPARRAQLPRDAARRLDDRGGQTAGRSTRKDPLALPHRPDRADRVSRAIEDGRSDARLAEHRLIAFGGETLRPDR